MLKVHYIGSKGPNFEIWGGQIVNAPLYLPILCNIENGDKSMYPSDVTCKNCIKIMKEIKA